MASLKAARLVALAEEEARRTEAAERTADQRVQADAMREAADSEHGAAQRQRMHAEPRVEGTSGDPAASASEWEAYSAQLVAYQQQQAAWEAQTAEWEAQYGHGQCG